VWKKHNGLNQRWTVLYLDKKAKDTSTEYGGFKIDKPFYIVSRMPMMRCARSDSNNVTLVTL
jgi:hypothetical protein